MKSTSSLLQWDRAFDGAEIIYTLLNNWPKARSFNGTAPLMARKSSRTVPEYSHATRLQWDRAFDGAEIQITGTLPVAKGGLQWDRAFDGAEIVPPGFPPGLDESASMGPRL